MELRVHGLVKGTMIYVGSPKGPEEFYVSTNIYKLTKETKLKMNFGSPSIYPINLEIDYGPVSMYTYYIGLNPVIKLPKYLVGNSILLRCRCSGFKQLELQWTITHDCTEEIFADQVPDIV